MKTAFICPLYDMENHFDLAINLYKSKIKYKIEADLIFIFSNVEHKDKFLHRVKNEIGIASILYSIIPAKLNEYSAKAVTKKLYGLRKYMNDYNYIILVDCESVFVKSFDVDALAEEIWESRSMLASNLSPNGFLIMRKCYKAMGLYYNKKLRKALGFFKYNFWFNELQVYKCSYLQDFFGWLKNFDIEKICNTWDCFEYYVFYAYLCIEHDIGIKKYHYLSSGGINEYLDLFSIKKQREIIDKMNVHWVSSKEAITDAVVMQFHLDRSRQTEGHGYKTARSVTRKLILILLRYIIYVIEIPEMLVKSKTAYNGK